MPKELEKLRKKIDKIDFAIVKKLAERFLTVSKIAEYKGKNHLPIFSPKREKEIFEKRKRLAKKMKLDELLVKKIFKLILKSSRSKQKNGH